MRNLFLSVVAALAASGCASQKGPVPQSWEDPSTLMAALPPATAEQPSQPADSAVPTTPAAPSIPATPVGPSVAATPTIQTPASSQKLIVTPDNSYVGKVATVNPTAGFVVLSFPPGHMPAVDQRLSLYRRGLKVGEVKITGPQIDENVVADITAGDSDVGDEVK